MPYHRSCLLQTYRQLYKTNLVHRVLVWEFVSKEISKKYILGNGLGTSRLIGQNIILDVPKVNQDIYGAVPLHPHNNILEIWVELGVALATAAVSKKVSDDRAKGYEEKLQKQQTENKSIIDKQQKEILDLKKTHKKSKKVKKP